MPTLDALLPTLAVNDFAGFLAGPLPKTPRDTFPQLDTKHPRLEALKREKSLRRKTKGKGTRARAMQAVADWQEAIVAQHRRALRAHRLAARQLAQTLMIKLSRQQQMHCIFRRRDGVAPRPGTPGRRAPLPISKQTDSGLFLPIRDLFQFSSPRVSID